HRKHSSRAESDRRAGWGLRTTGKQHRDENPPRRDPARTAWRRTWPCEPPHSASSARAAPYRNGGSNTDWLLNQMARLNDDTTIASCGGDVAAPFRHAI